MESLCVLLLALAAGALAVPVSWRVDSPSSCARQCTASSKFNYEPRTTYEFDYDVHTRTAMAGATRDHASMDIHARVYIEVLSKCDLVLRLSDVTIKATDPDSPDSMTYADTMGDFRRKLEEFPLRFSWQDGLVEELCPDEGEDRWALNIKRGILSAFHNGMQDLARDERVRETDVTGRCDADYRVTQRGQYSSTVMRTKDLLACTDRHGYRSVLQAMPYGVDSSLQSLPLTKSSHECSQEISTKGLLQRVRCHEVHVLRPFSKDANGAMTEATQTLEFQRETSYTSSRRGEIRRRTDIAFEHADSRADVWESDATDTLRKLCAATAEDIGAGVPQLFTQLVYTLRNMDAPGLRRLHRETLRNYMCEKAKKFVQDAVPMLGTVGAVSLMQELLADKTVTGHEATAWLTSLAFIQQPSDDMLREIEPLLRNQDMSSKALLPVSAMLNNYCHEHAQCTREAGVQAVVAALEQNLGGCDVTDSNQDKILLTLRAIGNVGREARLVLRLDRCLARDRPAEVRVAAAQAFRRLPCSADRNNVLELFRRSTEDSEVRINAYLAAMECPTEELLRQVKDTLTAEEVNQVGSFVWTHLTNLQETQSPLKQALREVLEDQVLVKEFSRDARKFSRNVEVSAFLEKYNLGATAESNLIWSPSSFIPRSASLNLTLDVFGSSMNLFEVGGRVEGLEYLLEQYLGPEGYFKNGEAQDKPDYRNSRVVKMDKLRRIKKSYGEVKDNLKGSMYLRLFGNELAYKRFQQLSDLLPFGPGSKLTLNQYLDKLRQKQEHSFTKSAMFLDSTLVIPTSAGLPLSLALNGTATVGVTVAGSLDLAGLARAPRSLLIDGELRPSGAVEISGLMSLDAHVTRAGLKMVFTAHSSSALKGKVELAGGQIFSLEFDSPREKIEIFDVSTKFFLQHAEREREQALVVENRRSKSACTGQGLQRVTGLQLCGEISFPNASMLPDAPFFPFTGPLTASLTLHKKDAHFGYRMQAKNIRTPTTYLGQIGFDTPGSHVVRSLSLDVMAGLQDKTLEVNLISPWKKANFKASMVNETSNKQLSGTVTLDDKDTYTLTTAVGIQKKGKAVTYEPTMRFSRPGEDPVVLEGRVQTQDIKKIKDLESIEGEVKVKGIHKHPVELTGALVWNEKERGVSGKFSKEPKKDYTLQARLLTSGNPKRTKFTPLVAVRTPESTLVLFKGNGDYRRGKSLKGDLQLNMDKVLKKAVSLKVNLNSVDNAKRKRVRGNVNFVSSYLSAKLRGNVDTKRRGGKDGPVSTRFTLDYLMPKVKKNVITFSSKFANKTTNSLLKYIVNANLNVKSNPDYNMLLDADMEHKASHSNANLRLRHGKNVKKTDDKTKELSISTTVNHKIRDKEATVSYNFETVYPHMDVEYQVKGDHKHDPKKITSTMTVIYGPKKAATVEFLKNDRSTRRLRHVTSSLSLSYPGREARVSSSLEQKREEEYLFTVNVAPQRGQKYSVATNYRKAGPSQYELASEANLHGWDPINVVASTRLDREDFHGDALLTFNRTQTYGLGLLYRLAGEFLKGQANLTLPERKVTVLGEGGKRGSRHSAKAQVMWDALKDPSQVLEAEMGYEHRKGWKSETVNGNLKLLTPFEELPEFSVDVGYQGSPSKLQASSALVYGGKDRKIDARLEMKKPASAEDFGLQFEMNTPFDDLTKMALEVDHTFKNELTSKVKGEWNKEKMALEVHAHGRLGNGSRDIEGSLLFTSTLPDFAKRAIRLAHKDDGKKITQIAFTEFWQRQYAYSLDVVYDVMGWQLNTRGEATLQAPELNYALRWSHVHQRHLLKSDVTVDLGNSQRYFAKVDGSYNKGIRLQQVNAGLTLQTPHQQLRELELSLDHQHGTGHVTTKSSLKHDRQTKASLDMNYRRTPGIADWDFTLVTPYTEDIKSKVNARYAVPPFTGHAEAEWGKKSRVAVDAFLTGLSVDHLNGNLRLTSTFPQARSLRLDFSHAKLGSQYDSGASIEYAPGKKLEAKSTLGLGTPKKVRVQVTTPFQQMTSLDVGAELSTIPSMIKVAASAEVLPVMKKLSAELTRDVQPGVSQVMNARLVTPFSQFPYGKVHASLLTLASGHRFVGEVEYPEKQVLRHEVTYAIANDNVTVTMELKTPFPEVPRLAGRLSYKNLTSHLEGEASLDTPFSGFERFEATFRHQQGDSKLATRGSVTYSGKTIDGDLDLQWVEPVAATLKVKTPYEGVGTILTTVSHQGTPLDFKTHGEVSYADQKIKSDLAFQHHTVNTELNFAIETPYQDFRNIQLDLVRQGPPENFRAETTLDLGSGKPFHCVLQHRSSDRKLFVTTTLKTPYTQDIGATVDFEGRWKTFTCKASANIGEDYVLNTETGFKLRKDLLDLTVDGDYTFQGTSKPAGLTVRHRGDASDFITEVKARHGSQHYQADARFNRAQSTVMAGFDLATPHPDLPELGASFEHTGDSVQFTTTGHAKWGKGKEARGKVVWERTEWKRMKLDAEGSCSESRHPAKLSALVDTLGDQYTVNGNVDLGRQREYSLTSSLTTRQPLAMDVQVRTPHEGFRRLELGLNHAGSWNDLRSSARFFSDRTREVSSALTFRYADPRDLDLEASLTSEMEGAQYWLLSHKAFRKMQEEFVTKQVISWARDKRITVSTSTKVLLNDQPLKQDVSYSYEVTSPFEYFRKAIVHFEHQFNDQRLAQKAKVVHNDKTWLDADYEVQYGEGKAASLSVREPHPMTFTLTTAIHPSSLYEADVFLNWNSSDRDANIRLQGRLADQGGYTDLDTDFKVKIIHPSRTMAIESSAKATDTHTYSRGLLTWDENAGNTFSYEVDLTRRDTRLSQERTGILKLGVPLRSVKVTGSRTTSDRSDAVESAFYWDADRDDSKHVAVKASRGRRGKAKVASLELQLPSIRKEYRVDNEMTWEGEDSLAVDGTTRLSYSSDPHRTVVLTHSLQDLGSGPGSSNYSLTLGLIHPATDLNLRFTGHRGKSSEKCSGGARLMYQTAQKQKKNFAIRYEIDNLRRQMDWELVSPLKTMRMVGQLEGGLPYHLMLTNTYDNSRVVHTEVTLDPRKRSLEAEMHYNSDKPEDSLHFSARYLNDSAIMAEIYREHDFRRVSDSLLRMRLNSSHILHTRVTWRPALLQEVQMLLASGMQKAAAGANAAVMTSSQAVGEELQAKYLALTGELRSQLAPLVEFLEKELSSVQSDLRSAHRELYRFYSRNSLNIRDISSLFEKAFNSFFFAFSGMNQRYAAWYVETERAMQAWLRDLQTFPIRQAFAQAITETITDIQQFRGAMGMQMTRLFGELEKMTDSLYRTYLTFTRTLQRQINGLLDDLTSDPNLAFLKERYLAARAKLQSLPDLDYAALSELLSLKLEEMLGRLGLLPAFNQFKEGVQRQLELLKSKPGFQQIHEAANEVYQQAVWAFTYWKVDESFRLALNKVYLVFKDLALAELSQLRGSLVDFDKSRLIVIDPRVGELQFELFLPIPLESLARLPHHGLRKKIISVKNFINSYLPPRNFSLWDPYYRYVPSSDLSNWIPPFTTRGWLLNHQNFVTFDGRHLEFAGDCSYVLARDMAHDRFSVVVNFDDRAEAKVQSLLLMLPDVNLEILPDNKVKVNEREAELPIYLGDVTAVRGEDGILVKTTFGVNVRAEPNVGLYEVELSGWHHGRVAGMLGTPDNEPYNDMTSSSRDAARDVTQLADSWEVGRGNCRTRSNQARQLGPADARAAQSDCRAFFEDNGSDFRPCFGQVSPEPFLQLCLQQAAEASSVKEGVCRTAAQYSLVCSSQGVTLVQPCSCANCESVDSERRDYSDVKMADVVLVVEEKTCNDWAQRHLSDLVRNIDLAYTKNGIQEVRYGLVSFGGEGSRHAAHINTIDGQYFGSARSFLKAVQSLTFSDKALPADPLSVMKTVESYPYRTGAAKVLLLAPCTACGSSAFFPQSVAEELGFTVHALHQDSFKIEDPQSTKDVHLFGADGEKVYTMDDRPARNEKAHEALTWPADRCSQMVARTKGALFDVTHVQHKHARVQKAFLEALGSRVAESGQPSCQECHCVGDYASSRTVCRPCSAASSWWNELRAWWDKSEEAERLEELGRNISNTLAAKAA